MRQEGQLLEMKNRSPLLPTTHVSPSDTCRQSKLPDFVRGVAGSPVCLANQQSEALKLLAQAFQA